MKKLKVFHLLNRYSDDKIISRLFEKYPDQRGSEDGYRVALKELRETTPELSDDLIKCQKFGCHIIRPLEEETYALTPPYSEILGSYVSYANIDFICNLLWELTFYGFTEKENKYFFAEVFQAAEDVKSGKTKTVKLEDFVKELK